MPLDNDHRKADDRGGQAPVPDPAPGSTAGRSDLPLAKPQEATDTETRTSSVAERVGQLIKDGLEAISGSFGKRQLARAQADQTDPVGGEHDSSNNPCRPASRLTEIAKELRRTLEFATLTSFSGETINRDMQPETYDVKLGDTLELIAARHLGSGTNTEDIRRHVDEIERLNQVRLGEHLPEGKRLVLPGHTSDGGTVLRDADGSLHTRWTDGVERVEREDGSGHLRRTAADSSFSEQHWGPRPENHYNLTRSDEGKYRIENVELGSDDPRVASAMWHTHSDLHAVERAAAFVTQCLDSIERQLRRVPDTDEIDLERVNRIKTNMRDLHARARRYGLPPEAVVGTYFEVEKMLANDDGGTATPEEKLRLADTYMQWCLSEEWQPGKAK